MSPSKRSLTVLIVEDEPDIREAVAEAILEAGHQFISVGDLTQARQALASASVDIILLDMIVDGTTCDGLLDELSKHASPPATVLTSADATPRSRAIATRYAIPLVLKPFDLDDLMSALGRAHSDRRVPARAD